MKGYIKLYRDIADHWIWQEKPFSQGQAWVDILMMVNHETKKFPLGKELVLVERGSTITSELKLMERWGWSKTKVRNFLDLLSNDKMLVKKTDHKKTTLTVCNYNDWQDSETTKELEKDHKKTTEKPYKNTNKNEEESIIFNYINKYGRSGNPPVDNVDNSEKIVDVSNPAFKDQIDRDYILINCVLHDVTGLTKKEIADITTASWPQFYQDLRE